MVSHKNGWWLVIGCSLMQIMAEQRIENGLLSVTLKILNLPNCLYTKKSCESFQSYEKSSAKQKEFILFFILFRVKSKTFCVQAQGILRTGETILRTGASEFSRSSAPDATALAPKRRHPFTLRTHFYMSSIDKPICVTAYLTQRVSPTSTMYCVRRHDYLRPMSRRKAGEMLSMAKL